MVLALPDKWIWDSWYVRDGDVWHAFFLQADKALGDPDLRHSNATFGHATSRDLVRWTHLGTCFAPAPGPAFDDGNTWTGSTVRGPDGLWHMFYTGSCEAEGRLRQRIGHATSRDLHAWTRVGSGPALDLAPGCGYEDYAPGGWPDRAMRDPWVMPDPTGPGWWMVFTARAAGRAELNAGGVLGFAISPDLAHWTLRPPLYAGGDFGQLEVPQIFTAGGRWYCLFCNWGGHWSRAYAATYPGPPVMGSHYLRADDPRGPWTVAPGAFLDGDDPCRRYAARILDTGAGLALIGFSYTPDGAAFVGEIADPVPVTVDGDGWLRLGA